MVKEDKGSRQLLTKNLLDMVTTKGRFSEWLDEGAVQETLGETGFRLCQDVEQLDKEAIWGRDADARGRVLEASSSEGR